MQQFNFDTIQDAFNPEKFIAQAEKTAHSAFAYVVPKDLSKTLVALTTAQADFARANIAAFKSLSAIAKTTTDEITKNFEKAVK